MPFVTGSSRPTGHPYSAAEFDGTRILLELVQDEEPTFDLFFSALDAALAAHPDVLLHPVDRSFAKGAAPLPTSGFPEYPH